MASMDTTQPSIHASAESVVAALERLADADPADAPPIAERLAAELSAELDEPGTIH